MKLTGNRLGLVGLSGVATGALLTFVVAGCGSSSKTTTATTGAASSGGAVQVHITAPSDGSVIDADHVAVRGTVNPPNATVQILGQTAQVGNGIFTGSTALHGGKNTIDVVASATGSAPASTTLTLTRLSHAPPSASSGGKSTGSGGGNYVPNAPPASPGAPCGGGLSVGPNTSCAFAVNVRNAFNSSGPGTVAVFSPVTNQTYYMSCNATSPHVCTGGNNASVYFP
jgi:Glucodextranase, domain B